jgi:N-acetyl-beta-hexosaminidase
MLLDTSRHWLPLATIMQHIDGMEMNKLNVRLLASDVQ